MDPDATWAEALANAWKIAHGPATPDAAELCAEALIALDEWLRGGGFYPGAWETTSERVTELLDVDTVADEALDAARAVLDQGDEGAPLVLARRVLTRNGGASGSSNARAASHWKSTAVSPPPAAILEDHAGQQVKGSLRGRHRRATRARLDPWRNDPGGSD